MYQLFLAILACFLFFPVQILSGEIVHLKFDGNLKDSAGERQGRAIGEPISYTADRFGKSESAVLLKKGSSILLSDDKKLSFVKHGKPQPFTVEWFQCYDADGEGVQVVVIQKNKEYRIAWNNMFRLSAEDQSSKDRLSRSSKALSLKHGEWTHVAVVFENTGENGVRFYQDGETVPVMKDKVEKGGYRTMTPGKQPVVIGFNYEGALDDLVIHDRALSADEIRQRAANTAQR